MKIFGQNILYFYNIYTLLYEYALLREDTSGSVLEVPTVSLPHISFVWLFFAQKD